jgi:hypothetical protein
MTKTAITEAWQENRDYELIPHDNNDWQVRILTGDFIECVIQYGGLSVDESNGMISFDFQLVYTPDSDVTSETVELQTVASNILHSILVGLFGK